MKVLLVIDLQNGVCHEDGTIYNFDNLITGVNARIKEYRDKKLPIIFVQHNDPGLVAGTKEWELVPELDFQEGDPVVQKTHPDSFYKTNLQELLTDLDATEIEICGAQTEYCIDATTKAAFDRHYQLSMQEGLSSTYDNDFMTAKETIDFFQGIWDHQYLTL